MYTRETGMSCVVNIATDKCHSVHRPTYTHRPYIIYIKSTVGYLYSTENVSSHKALRLPDSF